MTDSGSLCLRLSSSQFVRHVQIYVCFLCTASLRTDVKEPAEAPEWAISALAAMMCGGPPLSFRLTNSTLQESLLASIPPTRPSRLMSSMLHSLRPRQLNALKPGLECILKHALEHGRCATRLITPMLLSLDSISDSEHVVAQATEQSWCLMCLQVCGQADVRLWWWTATRSLLRLWLTLRTVTC